MATNLITPEIAKEQWLAERKTFIGGSEIYKLLNEKQYGQGCVRALAYEKMGHEPDYPDQVDDPQRQRLFTRGHIMEPNVAGFYEEETGRKLRRPPMNDQGLPIARIHKKFPWAGVHADRVILAGSGGVTETGTAEIKSRGEGPYLQVLRSGLFNGDVLQIQHGMFVNNHPWGAFITVGMTQDATFPLKHFDVKRDDGIVEIIKKEGDKFAETVWVKGQLPEQPFAGDDDRCKVCAFRMSCRGEELDVQEAARLRAEKAGKDVLVEISNPVLAKALNDRELVKKEIRMLDNPTPSKNFPDPGTLDMIEDLIVAELVKAGKDGQPVDAAYVQGFGKLTYKLQAGRTSPEFGKIMDYLTGLAKQAGGISLALEADAWGKELKPEFQQVIGQAVSVLKSIEGAPEVVGQKFVNVGNSFRSLRATPAK